MAYFQDLVVSSPLRWPPGWRRTLPDLRDYGRRFKRDLPYAVAMLADALRLMHARHIVLSIDVKHDGNLPIDPRPADAGAAVYFELKGEQLVMAQDHYRSVAINVRSLSLAVEAMRQLERHGGGVMVERAFQGFAALPAPTT